MPVPCRSQCSIIVQTDTRDLSSRRRRRHCQLRRNGALVALGVAPYVTLPVADTELPDLWYMHYSMILTAAFVVICGLICMIIGRPYDKGLSRAGDAWHLSPAKDAS